MVVHDAHRRSLARVGSKLMTVLTPEEIGGRIEGGEWRLEDGSLVRDLKLNDFAEVIALVDRVAAEAENRNHHPDILIHGWNNVRFTLSTHSEGGVTDADIALAEAIDALS
jgi:4a-hydroxytetrahydrobiopterin dehydratase